MLNWKILFAVAAAAGTFLLNAEPTLPAAWTAVGNAQITQNEGVITVKSPGKLGGINGTVMGIAGKRYLISALVKGEGKVSCGISGSTGWAYGVAKVLTGEFQEFSVSYFDSKPAFSYAIFSMTENATVFEVKEIKITAQEIPELTEADIAAKRFLPAEFPGSNGKLQNKPGALGGKAVWGKRWYNVMKLPVPANAKELYYYVHAVKNSDKPITINLLCGSQAVVKGTLAAAPDAWSWVKVGPVKAIAVYPEFFLNLNGDADTQIWVDQVVLSTDGNLTDEALAKAE